MKVESANLAQMLQAALRGAAKIVGCSSTHLILFDEKAQKIRIRLGATADALPVIGQIEKLLGAQFQNFFWPMRSAEGGLAARCWRQTIFCETSSLKELVGAALPPAICATIERLIGERMFACVPALSSTRSYGVLLFEKVGCQPFNRQQREVLVRYARRIGEILENDLMGQGQSRFDQLPDDKPDSLLLGEDGELAGHSPRGSAILDRVLGTDELMRALAVNARAFLSATPAERERTLDLDGQLRVTLSRLDVGGKRGALCTLSSPQLAAPSLESQLVRLTLGEPAPALFVDPSFRITSCNPATAQLTGMDAVKLAGQPINVLFSAPDEVMNILSCQALDPRRAHSERITPIRRRDGSLVPVHVEALLLADDSNQLVGFLLVLRPPAKRDSDHLEQQERLATMGEMAAHLAHEIRNPLVAIGATLESLVRDQETPTSQRALLGAVIKEIVRMDMKLKDYLAARREMMIAPVQIGELVDDARRLLASAYRLAGKTIRCDVDPTLTIDADYEAMKQVVFNLLLNALEASPDGGEVSCNAVQKGFELAITVEDRGSGLPASPADCLRPFFTTKKNGTGLGLAVCDKIAHAHGGFVELRNRQGGGCQATVVLPASRALAEAAP
jgi:PAS domain S-box-containing protein